MADPARYSGRYAPASGRRSPVLFNPARASVPVGVNYAPYGGEQYAPDPYAGALHVLPISHHDSMMAGRAGGDYRTNSIPITTTTYAVRKDREPGISRSTSVRDGTTSGRPHRSSTVDSSKRPPIIITTKHAPPTSSSHASSNTRSDSPTRDPYRSSEEQYYTQPGTSVHRSRSTNRAPYTAAPLDNDDYARLRERTGDERLRAADPYRPPRQPALYPYEPRHSASIDYGNEGYEYTKPSDLARYDLDTTRPPRTSRRDSFDRGYHRPSVSVSTDIGGRPYEQNERRLRGPPPTTRGLDRINRTAAAGIYDAPGIRMPVPPPAPLAPPPRHLGVPGSPTSERRGTSRTRPVSYHDSYGYMQPDDPPRGHNDHRDSRDREYFHDDVTSRGFGIRTEPKDVDDLRHDLDSRHRDERRDRREPRLDDRNPRRRSDEDLETVKRRDERRDLADPDPSARKDDRRAYEDRDPSTRRRSDDEWEFVPRKEDRKQQKGSLSPPGIKVTEDDLDRRSRRDDAPPRDRKDGKDKDYSSRTDDDRDREGKKDRLKDKVATGLGLAAASIGLGSALKDRDEKDEKKDRSPKRRSRDSDDLRSWESGEDELKPSDRQRSSRRDAEDRRSSRDEPGLVEPPRDRDRDRARRERPVESAAESRERDRSRREAEAALTGEPVAEKASRDASASSSTDDKQPPRPRRKLHPSVFNPNDAAALSALRAELAAGEKKDKPAAASGPAAKEPSPARRGSPSAGADRDDPSALATALVPVQKDDDSYYDNDDDGRGRELVPAASADEQQQRQVRVVSPPRAKDEKKPVKGILKQPKPQFPEEPNPVREGVAPHKDDKKKADVPPGARWTKINRALVNPEALTIGKERFEVRDDFVIVLRVLSKEEIQAYATATAQLRERKRIEYERSLKEGETEPEKEDDDDRRRRHRHHRREKDDEYVDDRRERDRDYDRDRDREGDRDRERDRDRDGHRRRRHRDLDYDYDDVDDRPKAIEYNGHGHGHHRSHRVGE